MGEGRLHRLIALAREGVEVERAFGAGALVGLVRMAETIEHAIYRRGSLRAGSDGLTFVLDNPPLRAGAFLAIRAAVDGVPIPAGGIRLRVGRTGPWRTATTVDRAHPMRILPGETVAVGLAVGPVPAGAHRTVRLELDPVAIPPRVWLEFSDAVGPAGPAEGESA
ncbi:MAG: hypothetical protein QXG65_05035 [Thermoplasmata archaeon]